MHWNDHEPPHFHAWYAGFEASFLIDSPRLDEGELPSTAQRLVLQWASAHRDELLANWERARTHRPLAPIEPLR